MNSNQYWARALYIRDLKPEVLKEIQLNEKKQGYHFMPFEIWQMSGQKRYPGLSNKEYERIIELINSVKPKWTPDMEDPIEFVHTWDWAVSRILDFDYSEPHTKTLTAKIE